MIVATLRGFAILVLGTAVALACAWAGAAVWFDGPADRAVAGAVAALPALGFALALWRVRPAPRALVLALVPPSAVLGWWLSLAPSNERDWLPDVARPPRARIEGDLVTISNLRNFDYRSETDYTERWEERSYDLSKLRGADMFFSFWGSPWIAHTIMSWDFGDGEHLAISIETRKEQGEEYSAVLGFFRQFELYYVVADELDLIRLRTNFRDEDVYLYHLDTPLDQAQAVLLDYLDEINRLAREPRWYNAATHNCTTTIRHHVKHVGANNPWDWRILLNGEIDELGYERGTVNTSLPFDELRKTSDITERARAADRDAAFSVRIRDGLPRRPERALPGRQG